MAIGKGAAPAAGNAARRNQQEIFSQRLSRQLLVHTDDDVTEQLEGQVGMQQQLLQLGVLTLCLDVIAPAIDSRVVRQAVKLCVMLLDNFGGREHAAGTMAHAHLSKGRSEHFFNAAAEQLQAGAQRFQRHRTSSEADSVEDAEGETDSEVIERSVQLLRLLRALMDGNFKPNQELMLQQKRNGSGSVNLINAVVSYLQVGEHTPRPADLMRHAPPSLRLCRCLPRTPSDKSQLPLSSLRRWWSSSSIQGIPPPSCSGRRFLSLLI